jgi:glycerol-3-phosphate dehydrogenase
MAGAVADHVCGKFGIDRKCRTADVALPGSDDGEVLEAAMDEFGVESPIERAGAERLGSRAPEVLDTDGPNPVVCQCESVTRAEVRDAIDDDTGEAPDLNEVRIRTRASMGTCQGGRCVHRLAAELYPMHDEFEVRWALNDLLEERWKGQRHTLWGDQLAAAMRNYALHATTMNRDAALGNWIESVDYGGFDPGKEWVERQETEASEGADATRDSEGRDDPSPETDGPEARE